MALWSQLMEKKLSIHLQDERKLSGMLHGFDLFYNFVVNEVQEVTNLAQNYLLGTAVSTKLWLLVAFLDSDPLFIPHRLYASDIMSVETWEPIQNATQGDSSPNQKLRMN